jgi:hypothetical protein
MLRIVLTSVAVLCASYAAYAQELTAAQRSACMGNYEKYCKGVTPGGRQDHCLPVETVRQAYAGLQNRADRGGEEVGDLRLSSSGATAAAVATALPSACRPSSMSS